MQKNKTSFYQSQTDHSPEDPKGPRFIALVPAAGSGSRFGASQPKQLSSILGKPMIQLSVTTLLEHPALQAVYVVLAPQDAVVESVLPQHAKLRILKVGGSTRQASVCNGLEALADQEDGAWVLVHDAARPGLTHAMLDRLIAIAADHPVGGILALPVSDTLKRANADDLRDGSQTPDIEKTISRAGLWAAQTPQMFRYSDLLRALKKANESGIDVTDEASAMEAIGLQPCLVMGSLRNWKVTYATDLKMVETLMKLDI
jgi:2-C-methyl-D-erythritol 4-phosphate cytidylyltransferase